MENETEKAALADEALRVEWFRAARVANKKRLDQLLDAGKVDIEWRDYQDSQVVIKKKTEPTPATASDGERAEMALGHTEVTVKGEDEKVPEGEFTDLEKVASLADEDESCELEQRAVCLSRQSTCTSEVKKGSQLSSRKTSIKRQLKVGIVHSAPATYRRMSVPPPPKLGAPLRSLTITTGVPLFKPRTRNWKFRRSLFERFQSSRQLSRRTTAQNSIASSASNRARVHPTPAEFASDGSVLVKSPAPKNGTWNTALHHAVENGSLETVDFLLKHGAGLLTRNRLGSSALITAAAFGRCKIFERLVEVDGPTPWATKRHLDVTNALNNNVLHCAVLCSKPVEMCQMILSSYQRVGADVAGLLQSRNKAGISPVGLNHLYDLVHTTTISRMFQAVLAKHGNAAEL